MSGPRELLDRYLRQRRELGDQEIFLGGRTAVELREQLARVRRGEPLPRRVAIDEPVRLDSLEALREVALGCTRCGLATTRRQVVFGEGNPNADVVVVGEAPGADEDASGRPFVGRAGKLLDLLLASVGFERDAVFICNVLKCRPPANRNPQPGEVEACSPFLLRQLELIQPRVILACGTFAAQTLLRSGQPISRLRGQIHEYHGVPVVPTYHPAALLRSPHWVRATWEDLQRLRHVLAAAPARAVKPS